MIVSTNTFLLTSAAQLKGKPDVKLLMLNSKREDRIFERDNDDSQTFNGGKVSPSIKPAISPKQVANLRFGNLRTATVSKADYIDIMTLLRLYNKEINRLAEILPQLKEPWFLQFEKETRILASLRSQVVIDQTHWHKKKVRRESQLTRRLERKKRKMARMSHPATTEKFCQSLSKGPSRSSRFPLSNAFTLNNSRKSNRKPSLRINTTENKNLTDKISISPGVVKPLMEPTAEATQTDRKNRLQTCHI